MNGVGEAAGRVHSVVKEQQHQHQDQTPKGTQHQDQTPKDTQRD